MRNNKFILVLALQVVAVAVFAQQEFTSRPIGRGRYSLVAYAGGGMGYHLSNDGAPSYLKPTLQRWNPGATLRILWHPDHLLKAGWETGYVRFYSYDLKDSANRPGKVALDAIPVLLEFSMSLKNRLNIFAGSGVYFLRTKLDYKGKVTSNKMSVGWMAAASYIQPLGKRTGLGTEVKWFYAAETTRGTIYGQLQWVWRFLEW
jgi:hypothetical protein